MKQRSEADKKRISMRQATRQRRKQQECKTFDLKITTKRLTRSQKDHLSGIFREAKWLRNHIVGLTTINDYDYYAPVISLDRNKNPVERSITHLSSHLKAAVFTEVQRNISSLAALKRNKRGIGKLKFTSQVKSIDLKEYGKTYRLDGNRLRLQGMKTWLRVRGAEQLIGWELTSAKLLDLPDGYHLKISAFRNRLPKSFQAGTVIGLDMGLKTHITLSDGREINANIGETERLKRLQRKLNRQTKGSNSHWRTRNLIQREYQQISYRKNDLANKFVNEILKNEFVFMQDENLTAWRKRDGYIRGGKIIQHSILGRVKAKLSKHDRVVVLPKITATTQSCICGIKTKHHPSQREFICSYCGYSAPRDTHAAQNMIRLGWKLVPVERGDFKPVESVSDWESSDFQQYSAKPEASGFKPRGSSL